MIFISILRTNQSEELNITVASYLSYYGNGNASEMTDEHHSETNQRVLGQNTFIT